MSLNNSFANRVSQPALHLQTKKRVASIDILRGIVMLLMLVDHVRERFFYHQQVLDPMDLDSTSTVLFFTRITAHFCAPVFVFLTGLSAWLYANPLNGPQRSAQTFLLKRGLFIIFIEITLINLSWFGNYNALYLQVMWAIGLSMIVLALVTSFPRWLLGVVGFVIVFGHNALEFIEFKPTEVGYSLWTVLHDRGYLYVSDAFKVKASYPVLPWIGVIFLGYFLAPIFTAAISPSRRQKTLLLIGFVCICILLILRGYNLYGETLAWEIGSNWLETLKSFINFTKYPPSLDFLLFTLGIALLVLAALENVTNRVGKILEIIGSAPMFFYIVHLYVLLISYQLLVNIFGPTQGEYWGVDSVGQLWLISILLSFLLYWPTKAFAKFKRQTQLAWVKYL